jgi:hypothetical protein
MVWFKGSTQEESLLEIFRFGYRKVVNDKMVPDPVGSGVFVLHKQTISLRRQGELVGSINNQVTTN